MKQWLESCTPEKRERCRKNFPNEEIWKKACESCLSAKQFEPSVEFAHIYQLYLLQYAGVQFSIDDLSYEEWMLLGELKIAIEEYRLNGFNK